MLIVRKHTDMANASDSKVFLCVDSHIRIFV